MMNGCSFSSGLDFLGRTAFRYSRACIAITRLTCAADRAPPLAATTPLALDAHSPLEGRPAQQLGQWRFTLLLQ